MEDFVKEINERFTQTFGETFYDVEKHCEALLDELKCKVKDCQTEVSEFIEEKYTKLLNEAQREKTPLFSPVQEGHHRIELTYDNFEFGDVPDQISMTVRPTEDHPLTLFAVLMTAAARCLSDSVPGLDEDVYLRDLVGYTEDYIIGVQLRKFLGGVENGNN